MKDNHWGGVSPYQRSVITPEMQEAELQAQSRRAWAGIEARQKRDAELAAERERQAQAEGAARLEAFERDARQRFLHNGGSATDFLAAWPRIKQDWLIAQSSDDPKERRVKESLERLRASGRYAL